MGVGRLHRRRNPPARPPLHLSVQAAPPSSPEGRSGTNAKVGVKRVVLPALLTIPEIPPDPHRDPLEIETFIFGNHGLMEEGPAA